MLWFLIIPILWFFMLREMWLSTDKYDMLTWPNSFMGYAGMAFGLLACAMIGGLIAGGVGAIIGAVFSDMKIWHLEDQSTEKLVSIRDKDGIEGHISGGIFLAMGHFESKPFYFYYTEDSSGAIRPAKLSANRSVYIHETDTSDAKLVRKQNVTQEWRYIFGLMEGSWQYHFYVPKGTVRRDFTM